MDFVSQWCQYFYVYKEVLPYSKIFVKLRLFPEMEIRTTILPATPESLGLLAAPLTEFVITAYILQKWHVIEKKIHIMVFLYW